MSPLCCQDVLPKRQDRSSMRHAPCPYSHHTAGPRGGGCPVWQRELCQSQEPGWHSTPVPLALDSPHKHWHSLLASNSKTKLRQSTCRPTSRPPAHDGRGERSDRHAASSSHRRSGCDAPWPPYTKVSLRAVCGCGDGRAGAIARAMLAAFLSCSAQVRLFLSQCDGIGRNLVATTTTSSSFLSRREFLVRRLHSLTGLIPVGAYMVIHLVTNASILDGPGTYQRAVYQIHSLGVVLPIVEWVFIFFPLLFHAVLGVSFILGGSMNTTRYPFVSNVRYMLQRVTGIIAFAFILWHVFHMHGWFHSEAWTTYIADPLGGHKFRPYSAASSLGAAMTASALIPVLYAIGVLSCVFHLANGLWTMGITWGVWISPAAQRRGTWVCSFFGVALAVVGMTALYGAVTVDQPESVRVEDTMYRARVTSGELMPSEHKRAAVPEASLEAEVH